MVHGSTPRSPLSSWYAPWSALRRVPSRLAFRWRIRNLAAPLQRFHRERRDHDWDAFDSVLEFDREFGPGAATLGPSSFS